MIDHIRGDENVCADILTRWTRGYRNEKLALCSILLEQTEQLVPSADGISWPDMNWIRSFQDRHERPDGNTLDDADQVWKRDSQMWIPKEDLELQLNIIVCSHCRSIGLRGIDATRSIVLESFWWSTVAKDV